MVKINGTARWIAMLISVGFGVWGLAATLNGKLDSRVGACESRIQTMQVETAGQHATIDENIDQIKADIAEIKQILKEQRRR
jgi:hypothetical protein